VAEEVAAHRQHYLDRRRSRGLQDLRSEGAPDPQIRAQSIKLLPLNPEQHQPIGAELLIQNARRDVAETDRAMRKIATPPLATLAPP
jgi:hypothetical protein